MFKKRKAEIRKLLENGRDNAGNTIDIDALTAEVRSLNDELADIERRESVIDSIGSGGTPAPVPNPLGRRRCKQHCNIQCRVRPVS